MVRWGELFNADGGHERRQRAPDEMSARTKSLAFGPVDANTES